MDCIYVMPLYKAVLMSLINPFPHIDDDGHLQETTRGVGCLTQGDFDTPRVGDQTRNPPLQGNRSYLPS